MGCEEAINLHSLQGCISVPLFVIEMNLPCYDQNMCSCCLAFKKTKKQKQKNTAPPEKTPNTQTPKTTKKTPPKQTSLPN